MCAFVSGTNFFSFHAFAVCGKEGLSPVIEVKNVFKTFFVTDEVRALVDVSTQIAAGEVVVVIGPSGSGKSTLLRCINKLETATTGQIYIDGVDVLDPKTDINKVRAEVGMVFQSFNLLPRTTALENVEVPALYGGGRIDRERALSLLDRVGLADRAAHFITELSGGEQQRVAIARAMMNDPPLLLADEPTGNLDTASGKAILELLTELHGEERTIILVTHDEAIATYAQRELLIQDGVIATDRKRSAASAVT
jgi:polar amino acid transport system ATP-binding protein